MNRIERLASRLDDPLLVTGLVNVRYLTGLQSSNAASSSSRTGTRPCTPTSATPRLRAEIDGVTFHQTPRASSPALAELLSGRRIAVEASHLSLASAESPARRRRRARARRRGVVEALRAVKEPGELDAMRRAAAISDRGLRGARRASRSSGAPRRSSPGGSSRRGTRRGRRAVVRRRSSPSDENGARPHAQLRDVPIPADTLVVVDAGCSVDGYAPTARGRSSPASRRELREIYDLCLQAQLDALAAVRAGRGGPRRRRGLARRDRGGRAGREVRTRPRPRGRARRARGAEPAPGVGASARGRQRRHGRAGDLPRRGRRRPDRGHGRRHRGRLRAADARSRRSRSVGRLD